MHEQSFAKLPHAVRGTCLLAASVASLGIVGALVSAWHLQAHPIWLAATPQVLAEVAACEQARDRSTRTQCKRVLVLARALPPQAAVLASR
jgi:hypothetical protein